MLILYLAVVALIVGMIASRSCGRSALVYVPTALLGALIGAFAAFGDVPFLLRHSLVNPFTLAPVGSVGVVTIVWAWHKRGTPKR
jgi:hypothetical protein